MCVLLSKMSHKVSVINSLNEGGRFGNNVSQRPNFCQILQERVRKQNAQRRDRLRKNSLFPLCYGCIIATNGVPKDEHTICCCFATFLIFVEPAEGVEDAHIGLAEVAREVEVVI